MTREKAVDVAPIDSRLDGPPASRLSAFFKGTDTQFGIFYPKHYLLAVFPSLPEANRAAADLLHSGRPRKDVISVSGEEVIRFAEDHLHKDGLWGVLMTEMSRVFGTEASYADDDLAAARKGAAFVAVYCPTQDLKLKAWKVLEPTHPSVARYYAFGGVFDGIEHLTGEN